MSSVVVLPVVDGRGVYVVKLDLVVVEYAVVVLESHHHGVEVLEDEEPEVLLRVGELLPLVVHHQGLDVVEDL